MTFDDNGALMNTGGFMRPGSLHPISSMDSKVSNLVISLFGTRTSDIEAATEVEAGETLGTVDEIFSKINLGMSILAALTIILYRFGRKIFGSSNEMYVRICTKLAIGWGVGLILTHACGLQKEYLVTLINLAFMLLATGPDGITVGMAWFWFNATLAGAFALDIFGAGNWKATTATIVVSFVLAIPCMGMKQLFMHWEIVTLPALGSTLLLMQFGLPVCILHGAFIHHIPTSMKDLVDNLCDSLIASSNAVSAVEVPTGMCLVIVWAFVWVIALMFQILTLFASSGDNRTKVDLNDVNGGQNEIMRRLLQDQSCSREDYFESKFPVISNMAAEQKKEMGLQSDGSDPFRDVINTHVGPSRTGGILERAPNGQLTENQIKILEICKDDEEQRDRLLFGGGLW